MSDDFFDGIATGIEGQETEILGRPRPGERQSYVLMEEPGPSIAMHYRGGNKIPHYKNKCPNCNDGSERPKPFWYVGGAIVDGLGRIIAIGPIELTMKCFRTIQVGARSLWTPEQMIDIDVNGVSPVTRFSGLLVEVRRADWEKSPRVARCIQRVKLNQGWPYDTRRELARIWGISTGLRIHRPAKEA